MKSNARDVRTGARRDADEQLAAWRRSTLVTGAMLGVGLVGFVDEAVFHQILQWHTFYWATDERGRILSDGLFHTFSTLVLLGGAYRLWRAASAARRAGGGALLAAILIGAGAFNAYDGVVQHLLLHLHLVNEHLCPVPGADNAIASCPRDVPLEIAWIAVGLALLVGGLAWWRRTAGAQGGGRPNGMASPDQRGDDSRR